MFQKRKWRRTGSECRLDRHQRMQIRIRRLKKPGMFMVLGASVLLFLVFLLTAIIQPGEAEVAAASDEAELTMDFAGDVMLGRYIGELGEKQGYEEIFSGVSSYWDQADFVFANLDSAVLKDDSSAYDEQDKSNPLSCDYTAVDAAGKAGINVFGCANNHSYDYGEKAVTELIDYFQSNSILYAGIGNNIEDAASYTLLEKGNISVAFIAITDVYSVEAAAEEEKPGVLTTLYLDYNRLVSRASREADVTVVYCYWGKEDEVVSNKKQSNLGHQLIDAGADIVIGMHPHVVQDIELYKDGIIFYSLGSLVFDQGDSFGRDSVMVRYRTDANGFGSFELIPVRNYEGAPVITGNEFYRNRIFHELTQNLADSEYDYNENGNVVIPFVRATDLEIDSRSTQMEAEQAEGDQN